MRYLDVLCIDGIIGVGKTSQVIMFRNFLNSHGIPNKIITFTEVEDTNLTKNQLLGISEYLKNEPDGVVICDGSIATDIVDDIAKNMHSKDLWAKHKDNLQVYESLNSSFNFVNVLLTPNSLEMCDKRLQKKANMTGDKKTELTNPEHLLTTVKGLRNFDNNMLTYNIKFNNIDLNGSENLTQIHQKILQIIGESFQIKKPSK